MGTTTTLKRFSSTRPDPCQGCGLQAHCKARQEACEVFAVYVHDHYGRKRNRGVKAPSKEIYQELFT